MNRIYIYKNEIPLISTRIQTGEFISKEQIAKVQKIEYKKDFEVSVVYYLKTFLTTHFSFF